MIETLTTTRKQNDGILVFGSHPPIIQSILDFDYLSGRTAPSVVGIVAGNRKAEKYFFGTREVLVPCYKSVDALPASLAKRVQWMLNLQSGRRALEATNAFFAAFPAARGGHVFAENVPEQHALEIMHRFGSRHLIMGPSGVGLLIPRALKLGAIGGVDLVQMEKSAIMTPGSVAVISTSGGMVGELIRAVADRGQRLSFAACIGGDRFPATSLTTLFALAESDPETEAIAYFGELGGADEYEIIDLMKTGKFTKPLIAYIAGAADEAFGDHVQFGHAKALVMHQDESARAKREALRAAGATAPDTFNDFLGGIERLPAGADTGEAVDVAPLMNRQKTILSTRKVRDTEAPAAGPFVKAAVEALLGKNLTSKTTEAFMDAVFTLTIDHGGHVSGAVNTMITARAGKDLVSSLAAGLLTIGPRFGGAVNAAAALWMRGVSENADPKDFVAAMNKQGDLIAGIGHRKYRVGVPDPRVAELSTFAKKLKQHPHYDFARAVEAVTTGKNGKLILNVDGAIAALGLDILMECEKLSAAEIKELIDAEFFNALFVIPRSVGFIAHFMEQKRNDEGLFRLPDELLFERDAEKS